MSNTYYVDAVSQASCNGEVVKIEFVNISQKDSKIEIDSKTGIAMSVSSFMKLKEVIDDLFIKMNESKEKGKKLKLSKISGNGK